MRQVSHRHRQACRHYRHRAPIHLAPPGLARFQAAPITPPTIILLAAHAGHATASRLPHAQPRHRVSQDRRYASFLGGRDDTIDRHARRAQRVEHISLLSLLDALDSHAIICCREHRDAIFIEGAASALELCGRPEAIVLRAYALVNAIFPFLAPFKSRHQDFTISATSIATSKMLTLDYGMLLLLAMQEMIRAFNISPRGFRQAGH